MPSTSPFETASLQVGSPYPIHLPPITGLIPHFAKDSFLLPAKVQQVQEGDVSAFRRNDLQVSITTIRQIPFVGLYVKNWGTMDGFFNVFGAVSESRGRFINPEQPDANLVLMCLVDGENVIHVGRALGLKTSMMTAAREACAAQYEAYDDGEAVNDAAVEIMNQTPTDEMIRSAGEKQVFRKVG